jgi:predicted enzyme related to lactoylglutathione lyase
MNRNGKINYIEMPAQDIEATKRFFSAVFGWSFVDYGPDYIALDNAGLDGGFFKSGQVATTATGSVLVVMYSDDIMDTLALVKTGGGTIVKDVFEFPGGRRFHFSDPNGNEFAVWTEPE